MDATAAYHTHRARPKPGPNGTVGSRVKQAREKAEKTQLDLAMYLGLSRAAIAQWESNATSRSDRKGRATRPHLGRAA